MNSWIDVAGWTLLYFLWQGAAIAVVTAIALRLLPHSRPQLRYAAACAAMALMLTAPVATALLIGSTPARLPFVSNGGYRHKTGNEDPAISGILSRDAVSYNHFASSQLSASCLSQKTGTER